MIEDKTATQTNLAEERSTREGTPAPGLVCIYSEGVSCPRVTAVGRALRLGRDASADLVIADPKVSRLHAMVEPAHEALAVTDLGSHNGTYVRGERLTRPSTSLSYGSTLRLGRALLLAVADVGPFRGFPGAPDPPLLGGPTMAAVRAELRAAAPTSSPVLIAGETGTGKERAAEALHRYSGRTGPLVPVNCAAIPRELVESELFGHARGAFSGSHQPRKGLFREAEGGSLVLDEVGELSLEVQAKLLRVLEDGLIRPVGQDQAAPVDVRIIASTNRSLEAMVASGAFRQDLYHRLAAFVVTVPPLRDHVEDVPLLTAHFLRNEGVVLSVTAMETLAGARWEGNVRQLRNALYAASARARAEGRDRLDADDFSVVAKSEGARRADPGDADTAMRVRICTALQLRKGNVAQVARDLGMRRASLYEAFRRLDIDPAAYREK